jgi:gliding motility-associated-like protein
VTLRATGGQEEEYRWFDASFQPIASASGSSTLFVPNVTANDAYYVALERFGCLSEKVEIKVAFSQRPAVDAGPDRDIDEGESVTLQASGGVRYEWLPAEGIESFAAASPTVSPLRTTVYKVNVITAEGCTATDSVKVTVRKPVVVPNAFSPNNDGINDAWEIANIETRQNVRMEVYNRWGSRVYESEGYDNPWDGTAAGKQLPVNTYFYVLTLEGGRRRLAGAVTITR